MGMWGWGGKRSGSGGLGGGELKNGEISEKFFHAGNGDPTLTHTQIRRVEWCAAG